MFLVSSKWMWDILNFLLELKIFIAVLLPDRIWIQTMRSCRTSQGLFYHRLNGLKGPTWFWHGLRHHRLIKHRIERLFLILGQALVLPLKITILNHILNARKLPRRRHHLFLLLPLQLIDIELRLVPTISCLLLLFLMCFKHTNHHFITHSFHFGLYFFIVVLHLDLLLRLCVQLHDFKEFFRKLPSLGDVVLWQEFDFFHGKVWLD